MSKKVGNKKKGPSPSQQYPLVEEAIELLKGVGFSDTFAGMTPLRQERVALCLLAAANLKPGDSWSQATIGVPESRWKPKTRDFIKFWNDYYGLQLASGSYDDVLRKGLVFLKTAGIVTSSHASNNIHDGTRGYVVSPAASDLLRKYGTAEWEASAIAFTSSYGTLSNMLAKDKGLRKTASAQSEFSPEYSEGIHGELLRGVVEIFLPNHVGNYKILFFQDNLHKYEPSELLAFFSLQGLGKNQAPDVLAVDTQRNLLFIFECVHSANPISAIRHLELTNMTAGCVDQLRRVFVTVLKDKKALKKFVTVIGWETEVWLMSDPEHIIHFDGENEITSYDKSVGSPGDAR